ncbi:sensor histidine kinase [Nocardia sp. NPDC020380]|uniref:sensor histidine kinase n=1 Tax=Nocardia sp. NPDC020380 TaxID=3364309 RepID=UPI00378D66E0
MTSGRPDPAPRRGTRWGALRARAASAGIATLFGVVIAGASELGLLLFVIGGYTLALMVVGIGLVLLPVTMAAVRWLCAAARSIAGQYGVRIDEPYRPAPEPFGDGFAGLIARCRWLLTDPATWRDLLWLLLNAVVGLLCLLPAALLYYVGEGLVLAAGFWRHLTARGHSRWYGPILVHSPATAFAAACFALVLLAVWLWFAPLVLRLHARFTAVLLRPTEAAEMAARVRHLTDTRRDALESQAAELRRIERDLHDGAQARLVAMGLALGAAERQLDKNPEATRRLIADTRAASAAALAELRDLVRGIHPPVLAERGLADALRALALASPLSTQVRVDLPGEPSPAIAAAVYFAVSELLANVLKHAAAEHLELDVRHREGVLRVRVTDDGRGGADTAGGSGLGGIRRRLATFDGTLTVTSPSGGPTAIDLEVPCVLS